MFDIKLKVLKRSGRFYYFNEAYSPPTFTPPLNGVIRGQLVFVAIFSIKSKVLMRPLRTYDCNVFLKWVILNPDIILVLLFHLSSSVACNQTCPMYF